MRRALPFCLLLLVGGALGIVAKRSLELWRLRGIARDFVGERRLSPEDPVELRVTYRGDDLGLDAIEVLRPTRDGAREGRIWLEGEDRPLRVVVDDERITEIWTDRGDRFEIGKPRDGEVEVVAHAVGGAETERVLVPAPSTPVKLSRRPGGGFLLGTAYAQEDDAPPIPDRIRVQRMVKVPILTIAGEGYDRSWKKIAVEGSCEPWRCITGRQVRGGARSFLDVGFRGSFRTEGLPRPTSRDIAADEKELRKLAGDDESALAALALVVGVPAVVVPLCVALTGPAAGWCASTSATGLSNLTGATAFLMGGYAIAGTAVRAEAFERGAVVAYYQRTQRERIRRLLRANRNELCTADRRLRKTCVDLDLPDLTDVAFGARLAGNRRLKLIGRDRDEPRPPPRPDERTKPEERPVLSAGNHVHEGLCPRSVQYGSTEHGYDAYVFDRAKVWKGKPGRGRLTCWFELAKRKRYHGPISLRVEYGPQHGAACRPDDIQPWTIDDWQALSTRRRVRVKQSTVGSARLTKGDFHDFLGRLDRAGIGADCPSR